MAVKAKPKKKTNRTNNITKSAATARMTKGGGASKLAKTVARLARGTKTGGGQPAGTKRGGSC